MGTIGIEEQGVRGRVSGVIRPVNVVLIRGTIK